MVEPEMNPPSSDSQDPGPSRGAGRPNSGRRGVVQPVAHDAWLDQFVGLRLWIGGHDEAAKRWLFANLGGYSRPATGMLDAGIICPVSADEWAYFLGKIQGRLTPGARVWQVTATSGLDGPGAGSAEPDLPVWPAALVEASRPTRLVAGDVLRLDGNILARGFWLPALDA